MNNKIDVLYLGSQSSSRQLLLQAAKIPFTVVGHRSLENHILFQGDYRQYVLEIAQDKMNSLLLPGRALVNNDILFVLTADTMVYVPHTGELFGKPNNYEQALEMLASMYQNPVRVETGSCLKKFRYIDNNWVAEVEELFSVGATVEFNVHPDEREEYLARLPQALFCCGAGIVEDFGFNYVKSVQGSYAAVIGIPIFELRIKLKELGFRFEYCTKKA